jgi:hypothetical protein
MALLKLGPNIAGISGSIGGTTYARNKSGTYARQRTKPINPSSSRQQIVRAIISSCRTIWADTLTAAQRAAWALYANNVAMVNRLGETINLSGYNQFCRSAAALINAGLDVVAAAPTEFTLPEADSSVTVSGDVSDNKVKVTFDNTQAWANEVGGAMLIYQGMPSNGTRTFFGGPYRYIGKIEGAVIPPTSPASITPAFAINLENRCDIQYRIVRADGRTSSLFRVSGTNVA